MLRARNRQLVIQHTEAGRCSYTDSAVAKEIPAPTKIVMERKPLVKANSRLLLYQERLILTSGFGPTALGFADFLADKPLAAYRMGER
jgi:hypothetical protein